MMHMCKENEVGEYMKILEGKPVAVDALVVLNTA